MPALESGVKAPEINLPLLKSKELFSLGRALKQGPVLAGFFKISCPVCQLAFPYVQRLFAAYQGKGVSIIGISQDSPADTARFAQEFGITFPIALDDTKNYPVSGSYGLTNVPSLFWITAEGSIELSSVGWSKAEMEDLNRRMAAATGAPQTELFKPAENVPDFKPG